jgi:metal-dependent amidase/aminoacylase/carboxypeptidase family protein
MKFDEILKFKLKRVNPFQGLVIDSDTWRDAHEYHRSQQRLHMLAFHNIGIIEGGVAINIIPEKVEIKAEARSLEEEKLKKLKKD